MVNSQDFKQLLRWWCGGSTCTGKARSNWRLCENALFDCEREEAQLSTDNVAAAHVLVNHLYLFDLYIASFV